MPALFPQWTDLRHAVIGMVHVLPLPGSPRFSGSLQSVMDAAVRDADALSAGAVHALMLENFGDVHFYPDRVPAHVVAAMTAIACELRKRFPTLPLGVNVLRNDGRSALAVALGSGANFIRVNVLCSVRVADQGLLHGIAHDLLRDRALLRAEHVKILADVDVKHSAPLAPRDLKDEVDDTLRRGLADGLIVSGAGTGKSTDPDKVRAVKALAPSVPVFVGSGVTGDTVATFAPLCDGSIVGTSFKSTIDSPVDVGRVKALVARLT